MSTQLILAAAALLLVLATFAQWVFLRSRYITGLAQQRSRHAEQMQNAAQGIDQARRQIAQLQLELGNARSQLARHAAAASAAAAARASRAALASRAEAPAAMAAAVPAHGFADTLPCPQYPHDPSLLKTYPARR